MKEGGGFLRKPLGCMIFAFSSYFGSCTSLQAEAKALLLGLRICEQRGFGGNVVVETDSLMLERILLKRCLCPWAISVEVGKIGLLLGGSCQVTHCFREANKVADILANVGAAHSQCGVCVYDGVEELPKLARGAYRLDRSGFPSFRRFRVKGASSHL